MNNVAFFEIQSSDPVRSIEFYGGVFGWKFFKQEGLPIAYWQIENAGINGGLLQRPVKTPPQEYGTNAFTCSVQVEDFDATAVTIIKAGGVMAMEKFAVPGKCWQGYFIDTDNNVFGIFQVDEAAT